MGAIKPTAEIEQLAHALAELEGTDVNEALTAALRETLERRRKDMTSRESPLEIAERIRRKYGIVLTEEARKPVDQSVYDELGPAL